MHHLFVNEKAPDVAASPVINCSLVADKEELTGWLVGWNSMPHSTQQYRLHHTCSSI